MLLRTSPFLLVLLLPACRGEEPAALEVGEVSGVVESEYGYHVLRLENRQPVPFEEASRPALLTRVVPPPVAAAAMEVWAATRARVALDPERVGFTLEALRRGCMPLEVDLLRSGGVEPFTSLALSHSLLTLPQERRVGLLTSPDAFLAWAEDDAREASWAAQARREGAEPLPPPPAFEEMTARLLRAGAAIGFVTGAGPATIRARSLAALRARGQEERIARAEISSIGPVLRERYPAAGPAGSCSSGGSSNSEIRNSENTL